MKLDLGAGAVSPEGFVPLGYAHGSEIVSLPHGDGTVDVVRASHVLEHFAHGEVGDVLKEWVRVLRPGGELRIAVPDFGKVAEAYMAGVPLNTQGYVMGGQTDHADFHKVLFDEPTLRRLMAAAGIVMIRPWVSELGDDCAALPISLNLCGVKPHQAELAVSAVMSLPRVTWTANSLCCVEALPPLRIRLRSVTGAYWGQCLERGMEQALREDAPDALLTLDYDSVFSRQDVATLMQLMMTHPEADAITTVQAARGKDLPLFTVRGTNGDNAAQVDLAEFDQDLMRVATAHFGLTLIRADKLAALPKPWFHDVPAPDGTWNDGRVDADVAFWRKWEAAGNSLFLANRVPIGHLDLMVRWPGSDLAAIYQPHGEWRSDGAPSETWK